MVKGMGRVLGLAVIWAFVYALPAVPLEGLPNLGVRLPAWAYEVDMWPQTLGIPGFIGGVFFGILLAIAGRLGEVEAMSAGRLVAWGAAAGLLVGGLLRLINGPPESVYLMLLVVGLATLFGAIAGPGSALVFRYAERRSAPVRA